MKKFWAFINQDRSRFWAFWIFTIPVVTFAVLVILHEGFGVRFIWE